MKSLMAFIFLPLGCSIAGAQGLPTLQRTLHSYGWGDRTYTCLVIDGSVVPLAPPAADATVEGGDGVTVNWPKDGSRAIIRPATAAEAALIDLMGKPDASDAWKKYIGSTVRDPRCTCKVNDFEPDVLDVNHWRIGAITMDYSLAGRKSSSLLMLWRTRNGSNLAVTMQAGPDQFKSHHDELFAMIGGAMMMKP